jgi:hypothetical protein
LLSFPFPAYTLIKYFSSIPYFSKFIKVFDKHFYQHIILTFTFLGHIGAMAEQDWCQIDFPEVEALALFFAASQYCLPTFLHSMPKLKVVYIYNYGSKRAILHGLPSFPSFTQIKSVFT